MELIYNGQQWFLYINKDHLDLVTFRQACIAIKEFNLVSKLEESLSAPMGFIISFKIHHQ